MQAEMAGLRADLLALRQFHLRSRAISTAGSECSEEEAERDLSEGLTEYHRPSRRSRCAF